MTGWIVLLVLAVLVLLVCLVRLGVAEATMKGGMGQGPSGPQMGDPLSHRPPQGGQAPGEKARKAEKKAQKPTQEEPDKPTLGAPLTWPWTCRLT